MAALKPFTVASRAGWVTIWVTPMVYVLPTVVDVPPDVRTGPPLVVVVVVLLQPAMTTATTTSSSDTPSSVFLQVALIPVSLPFGARPVS